MQIPGVLAALARLDELDRHALRLIYFAGLSQARAARQLSVPEATLRAHVARGMQQLGTYLVSGATAAGG